MAIKIYANAINLKICGLSILFHKTSYTFTLTLTLWSDFVKQDFKEATIIIKPYRRFYRFNNEILFFNYRHSLLIQNVHYSDVVPLLIFLSMEGFLHEDVRS